VACNFAVSKKVKMRPISDFVKVALLLIILGMNCEKIKANSFRSKIYKKYEIKDSNSVFKNGILILYKDNTFVNFGLSGNEKEKKGYLWYSTGTWKSNDTAIIMELDNNIFDLEDLEAGIKDYYKTKFDNWLTIAYFDYVREYYRTKWFVRKDSELLDKGKNVVYDEINA
jgi:hypothetical protein